MEQELNEIIVKEIEAVKSLLEMLDEQHACIVKNDIFGMEACVSKLEQASKNIAQIEVERRKIANGKSMIDIINEVGDPTLEDNYRKIKAILEETMLQKDTNELLIKQGLSFTNKMLNIINPVRETKTYNSYGKMKR